MENQVTASNGGGELSRPCLPAIERLADALRGLPQVPEFPTAHQFTDGMYCRTIVIPPGVAIVSKTHKKPCFFIMLHGSLRISTENGEQWTATQGGTFVAPAGKRAVYAIPEFGPVVAVTVHRLDSPSEDLDEVEKQLVVPEEGDNYTFRNQLKDPALAYAPRPLLEIE